MADMDPRVEGPDSTMFDYLILHVTPAKWMGSGIVGQANVTTLSQQGGAPPAGFQGQQQPGDRTELAFNI